MGTEMNGKQLTVEGLNNGSHTFHAHGHLVDVFGNELPTPKKSPAPERQSMAKPGEIIQYEEKYCGWKTCLMATAFCSTCGCICYPQPLEPFDTRTRFVIMKSLEELEAEKKAKEEHQKADQDCGCFKIPFCIRN